MKRRSFLQKTLLAAAGMSSLSHCPFILATDDHPHASAPLALDPAVRRDWLSRWETNILGDARERYCDRELGEEIGWLISPFLQGFYYGYLATHDPKWVGYLADWADSWIKRAVNEPGGFVGWPKSAGVAPGQTILTDSLLGEAMGLRPIVLMAGVILRTPSLKKKFASDTRAWLKLATRTFQKWDSFGCWREVAEGGLWVTPAFGLDPISGQWTAGYSQRAATGFSNPANKQNLIALWLLAMSDVTQKPIYRQRAEKWFRLLKSRLRMSPDGKYFIWDYWDPAGPWDYQADGSTRHWVGVHPNGGYYNIDVEGMVTAFEHGLVFNRDDIQRLVATNRDFMWNHQLKDAKFQRLDGGPPDPRWKDTPGVLWTPLVPYDETLRQIFIETNNPSSWSGLVSTPWFLAH